MREVKRNASYLLVMAAALAGCQSIIPGDTAGAAERTASAPYSTTDELVLTSTDDLVLSASEPVSTIDELVLTASEPVSTARPMSTAVTADPGTAEVTVAAAHQASLPAATTIDVDVDARYLLCGGRRLDLAAILRPIADRLMSQQITYSQVDANEWRDCSGNFLRLSSYLAERCPELNGRLAATKGVPDFVPGGNNSARPATAVARTTRDLAKWYADNGSFIPVAYEPGLDEQAALARHRDQIRPGTVLWFSHKKPDPSAGTAPLFAGLINHMGTVISVERDANGELLSYSMYHGRNQRKVATVTTDHYWDWPDKFTSGGKQYPPLGFWTQYLVGLAPIAPAEQPIMLSSLER